MRYRTEPSTVSMIRSQVHDLYWNRQLNCARVGLEVLAGLHDLSLHDQVLDAAVGMHGAGKYGAQCGLLEGGLMILGIMGKNLGFDDGDIGEFCQELARCFESHFGSLVCRVLRPQGFSPENPPHLCEALTSDALIWIHEFIENQF